MGGDITGIAEAVRGIWQQGWAPRKVRAFINITPPISMAVLAAQAVMVFTPSQVSDLRGVNGSAGQDVSECCVGGVRGLRARPKTGLEVAAVE